MTTSTAALDVRQFIDDQPVSRYQLRVAILCGLIVFIDGFDAQGMGYVAPALSSALGIPRGVLGSVISSGLVGMMIGALGSGPLADRIGRRPVLITSALVFGIGSLLTATASTVEMLITFRVLTGIGMGGAMPNAIALTSEYMPGRRRATAVATMFCGFSLGAAVGGVIAAALIPRFGWQSVFVVGGVVPILIGIVALAWLPESIRFLIVKGGKDTRVRAYLAQMAPGRPLPATLTAGAEEHAGAGSPVTQLFTEGRAGATAFIWVVYFMNLLNLYFLNSWLPTIISDGGIAVGTAIVITSLFQLGGTVGALLLGGVLDRTHSFAVLALCYLWAAISVFFIGQSGTSVPLLALTVFSAGVGVIGGQTSSNALTAEFYPTRMRSTGVGWALGIGRIGSIVGPILGGMLLARGTTPRQVFWAAVVPSAIAAIAALCVNVLARSRAR